MAQSFGYITPASYGMYRPPQVSRIGTGNRSLALAAAGRTPPPNDPFGLLTDTTDSARVARQNPPAAAPAKGPVQAAPTPYDVPIPGGALGTGASAATSPVTAPTPSPFDVNLDPSVAAVNSLTGRSDAEAQAAALAQKKELLLQYGDKNLIASLLGDPTLAEAAGQNPRSTLAQLGQARDRNINQLTEGLNKANLLYSGYRVNQEQRAGEDYQNQLAQAAANVNGGLGSINSNLSQALGQNEAERIQAIIAAGQAHKTDPGAAAPPGGGSGGTGTGGDGTIPPDTTPGPEGGSGGLLGAGGGILSAPDLANALALAASKRRNVAV